MVIIYVAWFSYSRFYSVNTQILREINFEDYTSFEIDIFANIGQGLWILIIWSISAFKKYKNV